MKKESINYFTVGLFVLFAMIVLMVSLYKITGRSTDVDNYYIEMENVSGIRDGSPVTYAGYEIGQIVDIDPRRENGQTLYRLEIIVKSGWQIPGDSTAQVVSPSMLGDKKIDISEGKSRQFLKPGDVIPGFGATDVFQIADELSKEFRNLTEQGIKPLLNTINKEITAAVPEMARQTTELLTRLNSSSERLLRLLETADAGRMNKIVGNAEQMTGNLLTVSTRLNEASSRIDEVLKSTTNMMDQNSQDLRSAVLDLRTTMGVVSENINGIVYNLDASSRNMNEFTRQLRDNPGVLLNSKAPQDSAK